LLPGYPYRGKLLLRLIEWLAARAGESDRKFRQARLMHEDYMRKHGIATDALTDEQRREAAAAPELDVVERLYNEALDAARVAGQEQNLAVVHQQLGLLHLIRGDAERARMQYTRSFETLEYVPFPDARVLDIQSSNHFFLALLALEASDFTEARPARRARCPSGASIDDDLGQSGAGAGWRDGFQRLAEGVAQGARWRGARTRGASANALVRRLASLARVVRARRRGDRRRAAVYTPRDYNDRLLLGLKHGARPARAAPYARACVAGIHHVAAVRRRRTFARSCRR
jgi:hypothetical protein